MGPIICHQAHQYLTKIPISLKCNSTTIQSIDSSSAWHVCVFVADLVQSLVKNHLCVKSYSTCPINSFHNCITKCMLSCPDYKHLNIN